MIESELMQRMVTRLTNPSVEDRRVRDLDFQEVLGKVRIEIDRVVGISNIPGLLAEDLESLLILKTYQMMQRGKYDITEGIKPNPLFYRAYRNLVRDIVRSQEILQRQGFHHDPLVHSYFHVDWELGELESVVLGELPYYYYAEEQNTTKSE